MNVAPASGGGTGSGEIAVEPGGSARSGRHGPRTERAATLGLLAEAVGLPCDQRVAIALNGRRVAADPQWPLVTGDVVAFS